MNTMVVQLYKKPIDFTFKSQMLSIRWLVVLSIFYFNISFISCTRSSNNEKETFPETLIQNDSLIRLMNHWWDDYDFNDISLLSNNQESEQVFVDFIYQLPMLNSEQLGAVINNMLDKTSVNRSSFKYYTNMYKHYLNNPNSPLRDDVSYSAVLEYLISSDLTSDLEKESYRLELDLLNKNKPGDLSLDFTFVNIFGAVQNLYSVDAPFKLLIFYDPNCHTCSEILKDVANSLIINDRLSAKTIKVLAVMPWNDYTLWKKSQSEVPQKWINGFDRYSTIIQDDLYSIQAFPTLYLLDDNHKVILKDADLMEVEYFLENN